MREERRDIGSAHVERERPIELGGVGVEEGAGLRADLIDFWNWCDCADLVIRRHHRDENGVGTDEFSECR